jgi:hypothetical protein
MLELTERQRALQLPRLLRDILNAIPTNIVLLDNIEVLFDVTLKQDPLRILQGISRNKTVVAAWSGSIEKQHLTYATPNHPEFKRYPLQDVLVVTAEEIACRLGKEGHGGKRDEIRRPNPIRAYRICSPTSRR